MPLLLDKQFFSLALNHFMVDALNSQRVILLTYFSVLLGLSNTMLGTISMVYILIASLTQPLFGFLADRLGVRLLAGGGLLWISVIFSIAMFMPPWTAIFLLVVASIGSAAFHPAGASHSTLLGRSRMSGQETTAAALFFFFGQAGFFIGPILGGILMRNNDPRMAVTIAAVGFLVGIFSLWQLRSVGAAPVVRPIPVLVIKKKGETHGLALYSLIILAVAQSWTQQNMMTFVPKYLSDLGQTPGFYGPMAALFMGGSALGNVLGGLLADRIGKKWVVAAGMGLSVLPFSLYTTAGTTAWLYPMTLLAGLLNGGTYSVIIVLAQRLIPGGIGFASGLAMGFIFSAGAIGAALSGLLADTAGLQAVFFLSSALALFSSPFGFFLKEQKLEAVAEPQAI